MKQFVIFDLDNCLSDDRERIALIDWDEPVADDRYRRYHAACLDDPLGNAEVFGRWRRTGATPIFLTARPLDVEEPTRHWIAAMFGIPDAQLLMRNVGDHRQSVDIKRWQLNSLHEYGVEDFRQIAHAYDDRPEIVEMYRGAGIPASILTCHDLCAYTRPAPEQSLSAMRAECALSNDAAAPISAADVLTRMAETFRERNAVYRDNYKMIAALVRVLFPAGVPSELVVTDHWHLFELKLVKLARFASTGLTHIDSIHDDAVYSAMIEAILSNQKDSS